MKTQLTRSTTNKVFGGVAGGIAESFGWDATLVRLGFVALTLAHGTGALLYLVLLLVMPKAGMASVASTEHGGYRLPMQGNQRTLGLVLLGFGAIMLASMLDITGPVIAIAIIVAGYYLFQKR